MDLARLFVVIELVSWFLQYLTIPLKNDAVMSYQLSTFETCKRTRRFYVFDILYHKHSEIREQKEGK